jgi:cysteine desulfurase
MRNSLDKRKVYLDHAAATPLHPAVTDVVTAALQDIYGNAGSFYQVGRQAFDMLAKARQTVADALSVSSDEIIFTGSGTESDNVAILGLARAHKKYGSHVVVSAIEHPAVLAAADTLAREGFSVTRVLPDAYGVVSAAAIQAACTTETILVSVMYANNEIGTIEPIRAISEVLKEIREDDFTPLFHTDACQTPGLLPTQPRELGVDAMTINSAKVYGPKGVGVLYLKAGTKLTPLIVGGHQEHGLRAGTENVPLIAGAAEALRLSVTEQSAEAARLSQLQRYSMSEIEQLLPQALLNGHPTERLPNNLHYCFPNIEGESLILLLDQTGIAAATGSACSSSDLEPSHVLTAIGRSEDIIHGSLRLTMGRSTTKEDLDYTLHHLTRAVERLQSFTASGIKSKQT